MVPSSREEKSGFFLRFSTLRGSPDYAGSLGECGSPLRCRPVPAIRETVQCSSLLVVGSSTSAVNGERFAGERGAKEDPVVGPPHPRPVPELKKEK
jgi:hypothetical protein